MTYLELIRDADRKIDNGDIALGEYEKMIEPLKREIQPERKTGRWVDIGGVIRYGCPFCHYAQEVHSNFCPNCGADMRGEEDGRTD